MTAELTVSAGLFRGLLQFAVSRGAERQALLNASEVSEADIAEQDLRVPLARYIALMRAGKQLSGDPALGLHFGETMRLDEISVVGLIGFAAATMEDALMQLNRYGRLVIEFEGAEEGDRFRLVRESGALWVVDARRNPNVFPELTEATFARMVAGTRQFGETPLVRAIEVTHDAPAHAAEYERVFRAPVTFGARRNAMSIDPAWLATPIATTPRYVFGIFSERAEALLAVLDGAKTLRGRIERLLLPILHTGTANMETVAKDLGASRQTVFRRLRAENVTFAGILDDLRYRLAVDYLASRKVSVNETAYLLGFSDPAAFSRAFKRWTGQSPGALRGTAGKG
ncbi:MAG: AraC family transcriptional regulator [Micropepsaceae bacterium]